MHHEVHEVFPGGKADVGCEGAYVLKEGLACRQCGPDQLIGIIAEGQEAVEQEGEDVEGG